VKPRANIGFQQRRSFYISIATWLKRKVDREPSTSISAIDISTITRLTVELSWRNSSTAKRDDIKVQRLEPRRCEKIWYSLQVRVSELGTTAYGEPTRAQMEVASLESSTARSRSLAMASGITVNAPNYCGSRLDDAPPPTCALAWRLTTRLAGRTFTRWPPSTSVGSSSSTVPTRNMIESMH
jgi:hypothetical protein